MTTPIPVTLADLTTPTTPTDALTQSLQIAQQLGLPTTAWQPLQMIPDVIATNATLAADETQLTSFVAQGAYASTAATMIDANGNSVTTWMDLRLSDQYNVVRIPASFAAGPVPYASTSTHAYAPNNPLHFQNIVTGATYTSTGTGSISVGIGSIPVQADAIGASSTSGAGVTLVMITPLSGVTIQPLTVSLVGSDAESNSAALTRSQNKLATLAPVQTGDQPGPVSGGAAGTYAYVAKTIPQDSAANPAPPYTVTSPITRVAEVTAGGLGIVTVYLANAQGAPSVADIAAVNAAIQALVTPGSVTVVVNAATPISVNVTATVYVKTSSGLTNGQITTNIDDALATYFAGVPIGGYTTTAPNILPTSDLINTMIDANSGTIDVVMTTPSTAVSVGQSGVPQSGTIAITVVFV